MKLKNICIKFGIATVLLISIELALMGLFGSSLHAQQSNQIELIANGPIPVQGGNASIVGNRGSGVMYYWVIAKFPIGNSIPFGPIVATNPPNVLSGGNYVQLNWNGATGATGYDVVRNNSPMYPADGSIAVVLNTASLTVNDIGSALSAYVSSSAGSKRGTLRLDASLYAQTRFVFDQYINVVGLCFVDTTCQTTAGGGGSTPLTTKGDLFGFSTVNARVGIGADGQVLSADSTQTNGLKWIPAASGGTSSVFDGSNAVSVAFSATPAINLANASSKSPVYVKLGALTANVTAVTFTNKTAGAKFILAITQDGTGGRTFNYSGAVTNPCTIEPTASFTTFHYLQVDTDGTTVQTIHCEVAQGAIQAKPLALAANKWVYGLGADGNLLNSQPDCINLSGVGTGCSTNVGTSGATIPLLNGVNVWSGLQTYNNSLIKLLGSSTGGTTFTSDNSSGTDFIVHVPAANDTIALLAASQNLTNKTTTTQSQADNSTKLATTAYVDTGLATKSGTTAGGDLTGTLPSPSIAANAVSSSKMAVVNTRRTCDMGFGNTNASSALANADLGPQKGMCFIPFAATVVEVDVIGDAGTPNIIVGVNHAGSVSNLVSSALATAASGGRACSKTTGIAGLDGTTCSGTLQNTSIAVGDYLEPVSGTAGGTAKWMSVHITYTIN